jgi:hypothetical protein
LLFLLQFRYAGKDSSVVHILNEEKTTHRVPINDHFDETYFAHGEFSDIVTQANSDTHGCIKSTASEVIDIELAKINEISIEVDAHIQRQVEQISSIEKTTIQQIIDERESSIKVILAAGDSKIEDCEKYYRRLLEEYVEKLEKEMTTRLDDIYRDLDGEKIDIFKRSRIGIHALTVKIESAKRTAIDAIHKQARQEINQIIDMTEKASYEKTLGYEQLTTVNLQIYSSVGNNEPKQGCDNIEDRRKYIKLIDDAKHAQSGRPPKRTVYFGNDYKNRLPRPTS